MTTEMMRDFAERNGISLIAMHGNRKVCHDEAGGDRFLAYVFWDSHAYFLRSARPFLERPIHTERHDQETKVQMDRDQRAVDAVWQVWDGSLQAGSFVVDGRRLPEIRQEWLHEGVCARVAACGVGKFSSISRERLGV